MADKTVSIGILVLMVLFVGSYQSCVFDFGQHRYDLTKLEKKGKNENWEVNVHEAHGDTLMMMNFCRTVNTEIPECQGAAVCQYDELHMTGGTHPFGAASDTIIQPPDGSNRLEPSNTEFKMNHLHSKDPHDAFMRSSVIFMVCATGGDTVKYLEMVTDPDAKTATAYFTFTSPHACPVTKPFIDEGFIVGVLNTVGLGWFLVVITIVGVAIYFITGAIVKHFRLGVSGIELIPHIDMWQQLPFLVADGTRFLGNLALHPIALTANGLRTMLNARAGYVGIGEEEKAL